MIEADAIIEAYDKGRALGRSEGQAEIERLRAALALLWDEAHTTHHEGDRGCWVAEPVWRKAMANFYGDS